MVAQLDVRPLRKPDKHPAIFSTYNTLAAGESFVLVNNHDPLHLRDEFETEYPASYGWDYLESGPTQWRIEIRKLSETPLPRLMCDTTALDASDADATGAVWKLTMRDRDLDSNIIRLPANGSIDRHVGADLDVMIHVLAGSGDLGTELNTISLTPGSLLWLPRRSVRQFDAGPDGLTYMTVHKRRESLVITARPQ